MPRLGSGGTPGRGESGTPRRPAATAYPSTGRGSIFSNIIFLLAFTFILRNVFFNDYRSEEIKILEASGKSKEDIEKIVPKTAAERRAYLRDKKNEFTIMKHDVAVLQEQVKEMREKMGLEKTDKEEEEGEEQGKVDGSEGESAEMGEEEEEVESAEQEEEEEEESAEQEEGEEEETERRAKAVTKQHVAKPRSHHHHHTVHHHEHHAVEKPAITGETQHVDESDYDSVLFRKKKTRTAAKPTATTKKTVKKKKKKVVPA